MWSKTEISDILLSWKQVYFLVYHPLLSFVIVHIFIFKYFKKLFLFKTISIEFENLIKYNTKHYMEVARINNFRQNSLLFCFSLLIILVSWHKLLTKEQGSHKESIF